MRSVLRLAGLLARARWRHTWNAMRARPAGPAGLVVVLALVSSVAYVALFASAFQVIGQVAGAPAQAAALALMAGAVALSSFGSRASAGDAVLAGTPENEFLLVRPVSIAQLVAARSVAAVVTDPFGALFLLPVLLAAAIAWGLSPWSAVVAIVTSVCVQFAVAAAAQTMQIAVVRWVPRVHRPLAWVTLRLMAALSLACVWMGATSVLKSPRELASRLAEFDGWLALTPPSWLAAPLVALHRGEPWSAFRALAVLVVSALAAGTLAVVVAAAAGMRGWEEAGAPWADRSSSPVAARSALTAGRREWRQLLRDRGRLTAFVALPVIFVGVQIFGSIGWQWSTATVDRIAVLTFSVMLYLAALGPLTHMQAERRAFWIMRTVPVSLGTLMGRKARAWSVILGLVAIFIFAFLARGVVNAPPWDLVRAGLLVVGGTVGMTVLAVGMGCLAADLSDASRPALGPGSVYLFLMVGGLYNLVLAARGPWVIVIVMAYGCVIASYWLSGMVQAGICLDAEVLARRRLRLSDASTLVLIAALGPVAISLGLGRLGVSPAVSRGLEIGLVAAVGAVAVYLVARHRLAHRSGNPTA